MTVQGATLHYSAHDKATVRVHAGDGVAIVFGETLPSGRHFPLATVSFHDPDEARAVLSEALSAVIPLCMTDRQIAEEAS
jgi:hypothetical protein